jgi:hypothetical protein
MNNKHADPGYFLVNFLVVDEILKTEKFTLLLHKSKINDKNVINLPI